MKYLIGLCRTGLTNGMVLSEQEKQGSVIQMEVFHRSGFSWIKEAGNGLFNLSHFQITKKKHTVTLIWQNILIMFIVFYNYTFYNISTSLKFLIFTFSNPLSWSSSLSLEIGFCLVRLYVKPGWAT